MAGLSLGRLEVQIGADTRGLRRGVRDARRQLRQLGRQMRTGINVAGRYAAGITSVGVALGTVFVRQQLKAIDATAKFSDRMNVTVEEMNALNHVAGLTGNSIQLMRKSMEAMSRRVGQAAQGFGQAERALDELGLEADELNKMGLVQQFETISRATMQVEDANTRAAIAADLFSRQGISLLTTMEKLDQEGLEPTIENLRQMGAQFDRLDAAKVEAANDAMLRVQATLKGIAQRATIELAPFITEIANRFTTAAKEAGGFGRIVTGAMGGMVTATGKVLDVIQGLRVALQGVKVIGVGAAAAFVSAFQLAAEGFVKFSDAINSRVNFIIRKFNKLPFVNIPLAEMMDDSGFMNKLREVSNNLRNTVIAETERLHELAMQPLPSEGIEQFMEEVRAAANESAKAIEEALERRRAARGAGGGGADLERQEQLESSLESFRESLRTERESEKAHHEQRMEQLREFREAKLVNEQEFNQLEEKEEQRHREKMEQIRKNSLTALEKFNRASWMSQTKTISSELVKMTQNVAGQSKRMFQINKAAAIAEASVDAIRGAEKTWDAYPYPWNVGMTAIHVAASAARLQKLKSASFSGGAGTAASVAGNTAAGATPTSPQGGGDDRRVVHASFNVRGQMVSKRQLREMAEGLNDVLGDGAELGSININ